MRHNNENPISAYIIVSHISFVVMAPLLLFIGGGAWLTEKFDLPGWCMLVFILVGIFTMLSSLISYLYKIIQRYGTDGTDKADKTDKALPEYDPGDNDYYYENHKK